MVLISARATLARASLGHCLHEASASAGESAPVISQAVRNSSQASTRFNKRPAILVASCGSLLCLILAVLLARSYSECSTFRSHESYSCLQNMWSTLLNRPEFQTVSPLRKWRRCKKFWWSPEHTAASQPLVGKERYNESNRTFLPRCDSTEMLRSEQDMPLRPGIDENNKEAVVTMPH